MYISRLIGCYVEIRNYSIHSLAVITSSLKVTIENLSVWDKLFLLDVFTTGTRSKIFNEIVFKDNYLLRLHEKCIYITIKRVSYYTNSI